VQVVLRVVWDQIQNIPEISKKQIKLFCVRVTKTYDTLFSIFY
jgi:hypothetical protein